MYLHWLLYREQDEACPPGKALFELDIELDTYPEETFWSLVTAAGDTIFISPEIGIQHYQPLTGPKFLYTKDVCLHPQWLKFFLHNE
jgi:hypothetical protein